MTIFFPIQIFVIKVNTRYCKVFIAIMNGTFFMTFSNWLLPILCPATLLFYQFFFFIFQLVLLHFLGIKILYHKNHHMKTVLFLSFQYFLLITLDKKIFHHKNNRENIVLFPTFIFFNQQALFLELSQICRKTKQKVQSSCIFSPLCTYLPHFDILQWCCTFDKIM